MVGGAVTLHTGHAFVNPARESWRTVRAGGAFLGPDGATDRRTAVRFAEQDADALVRASLPDPVPILDTPTLEVEDLGGATVLMDGEAVPVLARTGSAVKDAPRVWYTGPDAAPDAVWTAAV